MDKGFPVKKEEIDIAGLMDSNWNHYTLDENNNPVKINFEASPNAKECQMGPDFNGTTWVRTRFRAQIHIEDDFPTMFWETVSSDLKDLFSPKKPSLLHQRYETFNQAIEGHVDAVKRILGIEVSKQIVMARRNQIIDEAEERLTLALLLAGPKENH